MSLFRSIFHKFFGTPSRPTHTSHRRRISPVTPLKPSPIKIVPPPRIRSAGLREVQVKRILDGDTIVVMEAGTEITIRLDAIDCPEGGQPWGEDATKGLEKMIAGRSVYLETHGLDCHKRTLATIYAMKGSELINVNERMVTCGHAWVMHMHYEHLSKRRRRMLHELEIWARSTRVGLWKSKEIPVAPWLWRKRGRT